MPGGTALPERRLDSAPPDGRKPASCILPFLAVNVLGKPRSIRTPVPDELALRPSCTDGHGTPPQYVVIAYRVWLPVPRQPPLPASSNSMVHYL